VAAITWGLLVLAALLVWLVPPELVTQQALAAVAAVLAVAAAVMFWTAFLRPAMAAAVALVVVVFSQAQAGRAERQVTTAVTAVLLALRAVTERLVVLTMLVRAAAAVGVLRAVVQPIPQTRQAVALGVRLLTRTAAP
jgi:hypothetical protein